MPATSAALSCINNANQGTTYQGYTIQCGVDYFGNDLAHVAAATFADCIASCDATQSCVDVSYVSDQQACYMKSSTGNYRNDDYVWTAVKISSQPAQPSLTCSDNSANGVTYNGFDILCGVDYYGGDFTNTQTKTFAECIDVCGTTNGCIDVSYFGNTCYMKNTIGQPSTNTAVWTAKKQGTSSGTTPPASGLTCASAGIDGTNYTTSRGIYGIRCDKDYYGGDLANKQTASFELCIAACDATSGCIDVSYAGGTCYMKNLLTTLAPANNVWTAVLLSATTQDTSTTTPATSVTCNGDKDDGTTYTAQSGGQYQIACGVDYAGGDMAKLSASSFGECIEKCDKTSPCVDIAYVSGTCYLKSFLTNPVQLPYVWAAKYIGRASSSMTTTTTTAAATTTPMLTTTTTSSVTTTFTTITTTPVATTTTTTSAPATTTTSAVAQFRIAVLFYNSVAGYVHLFPGGAECSYSSTRYSLFSYSNSAEASFNILSDSSYLGYQPRRQGEFYGYFAAYGTQPMYSTWTKNSETKVMSLNGVDVCMIDDGTLYAHTAGMNSDDNCINVRLVVEGEFVPPQDGSGGGGDDGGVFDPDE